MYTPALVQDQKNLDFLPYPPLTLCLILFGQSEKRNVPCFTVVESFLFSYLALHALDNIWTFIPTSFFTYFIVYNQFEQTKAEIVKVRN